MAAANSLNRGLSGRAMAEAQQLSAPGKENERPARTAGLCGGAKGIRTLDLYNAIVALSQLSYSPLLFCCLHRRYLRPAVYSKFLGSVKSSGLNRFSGFTSTPVWKLSKMVANVSRR